MRKISLILILVCFIFPVAAWAAAYAVTVNQPAHGTITPSGVVSVNNDPFNPTTCMITPDHGYTVADVQTAGVSQGGVTSFTYYGIWYNTTLSATIVPTPNNTPETFYVDGSLAADITDGKYSIANRNNTGSDGNAYATLSSACLAAGPGDTVYIRGGTYSGETQNHVLWPKVSGTALSPILFKAYAAETPIFTGNATGSYPSDNRLSISRCPISMRGLSYITVDGLTFDGTAGWAWIGYCDHIIIQNCKFLNSKWDSKGTARLHYSNYCAFRNCTFTNSSYDALLVMNSNYNVIENCTFTGTFGHTNLSLRSASRNVVRGNHFSNDYLEKLTEVFDQKLDIMDPLNPSYTPVPGYNGTQHNLFESNWYGFHTDYSRASNVGSRCSAIQFSGQKTIIRRNVFSNPAVNPPDPSGTTAGGVGIVWRWGGSWDTYGWNGNSLTGNPQSIEAGYVWGNRVYNNTFYGNDMGQMTFPADNSMGASPNPPPMKNVQDWQNYPFTDQYRFDDNILTNNILMGSTIYYRRNQTYITQCEGMPVQVFINGRRSYTYWKANDFFGVAGGSQNDFLIHDQVDYPYQAPKNPDWYNSHLPDNFIGNVQHDPVFATLPDISIRDSGDFHLQSSSPLIDTGAFLTKTANSGSGTSLLVEDAKYFYDGYGIAGEAGDEIQLEGQADKARILHIDYDANTITLGKSLTWVAGQGVSLAYSGSAPDIGAYEYAPPAAAVVYGDVSGDVEISAYDAALAAQASVGIINLTADQTKAADVSGDGEVSAYDAALIAQKAVGLIDKFPCEG